jgi:hypothetical protein
MITIWVIFYQVCVIDVCEWRPAMAPMGWEFITREDCEDAAREMLGPHVIECRQTRRL